MEKNIIIPGVCYEAVKALKDAERGRLILAAMVYRAEGRELSLCGGERYLWPEFKAEIDKDRAEEVALRLKNSENGRKGGRPKSHENPNKAVAFSSPSFPLDNPLSSPDSSQKEKPPKGGKKKKGFSPPTLEEVRAYCIERQNGIDPEDFLAYYEANGWVQGKSCKPIVDWKACVRTWERSRANQQPFEQQQQGETKSTAAPRFLGTEIINGEEVAIFEEPGC